MKHNGSYFKVFCDDLTQNIFILNRYARFNIKN